MPDFRAYSSPTNIQGRRYFAWFVDVQAPHRLYKSLPIVYQPDENRGKFGVKNNLIRRSFAMRLGFGGLEGSPLPVIDLRFIYGAASGDHKTDFFPLEFEIVDDNVMDLYCLANSPVDLILVRHPEYPDNALPIRYFSQDDYHEIVFAQVPCAAD